MVDSSETLYINEMKSTKFYVMCKNVTATEARTKEILVKKDEIFPVPF